MDLIAFIYDSSLFDNRFYYIFGYDGGLWLVNGGHVI